MSPDLVLENITYEDQGEYVCEAVNIIGGEKRVVRSEVVKVIDIFVYGLVMD